MKKLLTLTIYAAAIMAASVVQVKAQDDLDALARAAATPTPAPAATPRTTTATPPSRTTAAAAPRPTTAPAAPRPEVKPDLSHAQFVGENDLASLAGKKVSNTYLTGTYKANGEKAGGRTVFTTRNVIFGSVIRGSTRILVHYPKPPDPRTLAAGNSCQWGKDSPLHLERVEQGKDGITAYATDTP